MVAAPGNDPFDHPTQYYTNYSRTLHALIVEIIGTEVTVRRETLNFDSLDKSRISGKLLEFLPE